jgi:hypothetical protein
LRRSNGVPGPFGRASFLGAQAPASMVLSVIRKSGSRFSGEIALPHCLTQKKPK